jgi:hypothetical protein
MEAAVGIEPTYKGFAVERTKIKNKSENTVTL